MIQEIPLGKEYVVATSDFMLRSMKVHFEDQRVIS